MEREILFRGKRVNKGKWIEGNLITGVFTRCGQDIPYILNPDKADYYCFEDFSEENGIFEVDPETVCQYTDSIAIGGKKIFTNDIVEEGGTIGIVKFGKYGNGFHLGYYIDWITYPHLRNELCYWEDKVRVIGNIFENPELLKGDSK